MNKNKIRDFFDELAPSWDDHMIRNEEIIKQILDNAGVIEGADVLDVACGTGVLIKDYLSRKVNYIEAIDLSPKMIEIARNKYPNIKFVCFDGETYKSDKRFDLIMIYNAFPHFENPDKLIANLSGLLKTDGRLSIAHNMSLKQINKHHENVSEDVSSRLMEIDDLTKIMNRYLKVDIKISDDQMYQIVGIKVQEEL